MTGDNAQLVASIVEQIEAADGFVEIDGRTMVKAAVVKTVMTNTVASLLTQIHERVDPLVAHEAEAARKLVDELDRIGRELTERIADLFPTVN